MSLKERIRTWLGVEERAITPAQLFNTGQWVELFPAAGQAVTPQTVMQAAQGACVRLLADDIATLPADVFSKSGDSSVPAPKPSWMVSPSGRPTDLFLTYVSDWITSIGTSGHVFTLALPSILDTEYVEVLDPDTVDLEDRDGKEIIRVNGEERNPLQILHVPWVRLPGQLRGINPVQASRESIALEIATWKYAGAFFANGGTLGGIVSVPGDPSTVDVDSIREGFEARHKGERNWWKPAILTGGATYDDSVIKPESAALEALWRGVLEAAARIYHIPPHLLGSQDPGGSSYSSVEQRSIEYVVHGVRPFVTRFERAHDLLLGRGRFMKLSMNALLRGDAKSRGEFYQIMTGIKAMQPSYAASLEDFPPGQAAPGWLETPNNNGPREAAPASPGGGGERSEPVNVTLQDAPITVHAAPVAVHAAPTAIESHAHISSVQLSEEAARGITDRVTDHVTESQERVSGDLGQLQADIITKSDEVIAKTAADAARIEARLDALEAKANALPPPITRQVIRDENGRISGVVERQGDRTTRKAVERDSGGAVLRIVEVAA